MKRRIGLLVLLTILLGGILAGCNNNEVYRLIKVNSFEGETSMNRAEEVIEMFEGIQLVSNDKVTTGSDGLVELLVDSDKNIVASADTCFAIEAVGDETQGKVTINLEYGTTLIEIQNKLTDGSEFEVVTPNATLSVRGTTFEVNYDTVTNETTVTVYDGTVEVATNIQSRDVNAGETVVVQDVNIVDANAEDIGDVSADDTGEEYVPDHTTDSIPHTEEIMATLSGQVGLPSISIKQLEGYEVIEGNNGEFFCRVKNDAYYIRYSNLASSAQTAYEQDTIQYNSTIRNLDPDDAKRFGELTCEEFTNEEGELIYCATIRGARTGDSVTFYKAISPSQVLEIEVSPIQYNNPAPLNVEDFLNITKDCYIVLDANTES